MRLFLFLLAGLLSISAGAVEGGLSGGGGGTTVVFQGQRVLIDLFMLKEKARMRSKLGSMSDPVAAAEAVLRQWDQKELAMASMLSLTSFNSKLIWNLTDKELPLSQRFYIPDTVKDQVYRPKTVAYYRRDEGGSSVTLSRPGLAELDTLSQIGVIVHETVRHVQIGLRVQSQPVLDEASLQEATAIYVLCKPNSALSMYINFLLSGRKQEASQRYGDLDAFIGRHCQESEL